jgi:hypothetical protein
MRRCQQHVAYIIGMQPLSASSLKPICVYSSHQNNVNVESHRHQSPVVLSERVPPVPSRTRMHSRAAQPGSAGHLEAHI